MEMERRAEQSISLSISRIAEMATPAVTNREKEYLEWAKHKAPWIALGTFLCVLSPVWLLMLGGR